MNAALGVAGIESTLVDDSACVDYAGFKHNRSDSWTGVTAEALVDDAATEGLVQ